jgi:hypothetical protein
MQTFRRKPSIVEAVVWDDTPEAVAALEAWSAPYTVMREVEGKPAAVAIGMGSTLGEWVQFAGIGDYIVRDIDGFRFVVCSPEVFHANFEVTP